MSYSQQHFPQVLHNVVFLALAFALAIAVKGSPSQDLADAHDAVKLMQSQGAGADACQALAESSINDVNSDVASNTALLNVLSTGAECAQKGQNEVKSAQNNLNTAQNDQDKAKSDLSSANAVTPSVTVPSMSALMTMGDTCDFLFKSDAYENAAAAILNAQNVKIGVDSRVSRFTSDLSAAQVAAKAAASKCRCDARAKLESQWSIVSNPKTAADRAASWTQAQNILCALQNKATCIFPAVPTMTKPVLTADTMAESCVSAPKYLGCYRDTETRALNFGPKNYGYNLATCDAACPNFAFFALQDNGWCCCTNDKASAMKYGTATSCPVSRLGGGWGNDLYGRN